MYVKSSKQLGEGIFARYGENNGPMKYKIKREISMHTQGNILIMDILINSQNFGMNCRV